MVRPCSTSATMFVNPGWVRTTLAAPLATSVALLTAMPTSAWRRAGASLTPSPVMPVTCPAACTQHSPADYSINHAARACPFLVLLPCLCGGAHISLAPLCYHKDDCSSCRP